MELKPAYITIVEGPPPDFQEVINRWAGSVMEGLSANHIALVEMRTFDGPKLVKRCQDAWDNYQPARLNFPLGNGNRGELDIIATRWETVAEGHKLYLWIRLDGDFVLDEDDLLDFDF